MRSCAPVQCYEDGLKEMRLSLSVTRRNLNSRKKQQQHVESVMGGLKRSHGILEKPKYTTKSSLFQQAYDTDGSVPTSQCHGLKQNLSLQNKGKLPFDRIHQTSIAAGRRHKMPAKKSMMMDDLHHRLYSPSTDINYHMIDDVPNRAPCQTQYLTYHLEKFPSRHRREALSEKKRVALLKLLVQQLVSRLDTAEMHPSFLLNGNVQAHAVLLKSNLEKFQRELHATVKALEGRYSRVPREKCSGYIVLPSKLERAGSSEVTLSKQPNGPLVGLDSMQHDSSSETSSETTASFPSVLLDSSSPQKAKEFNNYSRANRESSKHKYFPDSLVTYKESNKSVLEREMQDNMFRDFELRIQSFPTDSKGESINHGQHTWNHELLDKELEKLDAEIKETKSRMARKLLLTHPRLADTNSITSPLSNSPRCSDNAAPFIEDDAPLSATLVHATTDQIVVLPSLSKETDRLQHVSAAPNELKIASLDNKISREAVDSTLVAEKIFFGNQKDVKNDVKLKMNGPETVPTNHMVDYCKIDVELPSNAAPDSKTLSITSLETSLCIDTKRRSDSSMEASPTNLSVRKVEVSQVAAEPNSAGGLTVLFKKNMETNQNVLVGIITETLMQELLDYELSDMVLHCRVSPINRVKDIFSESTSISRDAPMLHLRSHNSNSPCRPGFISLVPSQKVFDTCVTGSSYTYDDYQNNQSYYTENCSSPAVGSPEIYMESFKLTSKRLVDKYVEENLEAPGLLCSYSLLELYASGKTLSLVLGKQCFDGREREEQLYGKMIMEAICECLDKNYLRFCLPSFFLFLLPCPEGPHLKKMLISKVNEHADAACEGGFSLEYILEKSLDEEDWKTPYHEIMEVLHNISEYVMMDMIENFLLDVIEVKQLACAPQAMVGFMHTAESKALLC